MTIPLKNRQIASKRLGEFKKTNQRNPMPIEPNSPEDLFIVVVMGVSGCGKSTVASLLADILDADFKDGDELHPADNIQRMSQGIPLTDEDREPWLHAVADYARTINTSGRNCVIACSALRKSYRDILRQAGSVWFVHLTGAKALIASRMHLRTGHFMPEKLLDSQFSTLEIPDNESNVVAVDITPPVDTVAKNASNALNNETLFPRANH